MMIAGFVFDMKALKSPIDSKWGQWQHKGVLESLVLVRRHNGKS